MTSLKINYLRVFNRRISDYMRLFIRIIADYIHETTEMTEGFHLSCLRSRIKAATVGRRPVFKARERTSAPTNDEGGTRVFLAVLEDDQMGAAGRWGIG
jgi:hypothetical protein